MRTILQLSVVLETGQEDGGDKVRQSTPSGGSTYAQAALNGGVENNGVSWSRRAASACLRAALSTFSSSLVYERLAPPAVVKHRHWCRRTMGGVGGDCEVVRNWPGELRRGSMRGGSCATSWWQVGGVDVVVGAK
jgi:hypothetical protein